METVTLIHPVSKEEFEYEAEHAERILKMNTGWKKQNKSSKTKASATTKRDKKDTGIKAASEDDCGCGKA